MPTSASGIFDLKLEGQAGNSFVGSAKSSGQAAKQHPPVTPDVVFNAVPN